MQSQILVRKYLPEDAESLAKIYFNTIHKINSRDYTKEQVDVWAPQKSLDPEGWSRKFLITQPFVALINEEIVGFAEFEPDGHIDCFYCHHLWIGRGVGKALMHKIYEEAQKQNIPRIFAEVSITAKKFFDKEGFQTICEQTIIRENIKLTNYKMEKPL